MAIGDAGLIARPELGVRAAETLTGNLNTLDTWRDGDLHLYLVTLNTKPGEKTVVIKIKNFAGNELPAPGTPQQMYNRYADAASHRRQR